MRTRSNSVVRLDYYQRLLTKTVLCCQDPVTGLFATSQIPAFKDHAWVRDNCYAVHSIWGLALAYRKQTDFDEDRAKTYELEQICVKVMRSILVCMMRQLENVENFKKSQSKDSCLHAKYSCSTRACVCGDYDWGHLQIDATSLYLLTLAQMTASGLQIVFNLDEVSFIQSLVFYIETAYRIPDFGIWERGDKTNHGVPELNASSIGMAKAALQALNDLDLFGAYGSPSSVIHVLADEMQQCQAVLQSMLPWESCSKEVDAALMSVISYPAFAVEDAELIRATRQKILDRLEGKYGCRRFLRDGYRNAREDPNRLYYEPWELHHFENTECEWPLFFCYLFLDGLYSGNKEQAKLYREKLESLTVKWKDDGLKVLPELYMVPADSIDAEAANPGSQHRVAAGCIPHTWAQSLYILGCLIDEGFIQAAEVDPLNRRLSTEKRPDTVVQVVVLAEDRHVQEKLASHGIKVETVDQVKPFVIQPASVLGKMYAQLGRNEKLGLTGRPNQSVGLLSTSKLYMIDNRIFCFSPQQLDISQFYLANDSMLLTDMIRLEIAYLSESWRPLMGGRPTFALLLRRNTVGLCSCSECLHQAHKNVDAVGPDVASTTPAASPIRRGSQQACTSLPRRFGVTTNTPRTNTACNRTSTPIGKSFSSPNLAASAMKGNPLHIADVKKVPTGVIGTLKKLKSGFLSGTRIKMGSIQDFLTTSCVTQLTFLSSHHRENLPQEIDRDVREFLESILGPSESSSAAGRRSRLPSLGSGVRPTLGRHTSTDYKRRMTTVRGLAQRHRSIMLQADDEGLQLLRSKFAAAAAAHGTPGSQASYSPGSSMQSGNVSPSAAGSISFRSPDESAHHSDNEDVTPTTSLSPHGSPPGSPIIRAADVMTRVSESSHTLKGDMALQELDCEELVDMLMDTEDLEEQADIVHYLWMKKGGDWDTEIGGRRGSTVRRLVKELYEKACQAQLWWLVRLTAGLLEKRIEDLANAVTDLSVRQKQITVGMPSVREEAITRPLPPEELQKMIKTVFGDDTSSAMLTQELLIYLGMFVRTEPSLFAEMIRLRVGLIAQVMAAELARALQCSVEDAPRYLLNLSPYEMKTLLHHILSGKEFAAIHAHVDTSRHSKTAEVHRFVHSVKSVVPVQDESDEEVEGGQWLRRRQIDGALNRVPPDFYQKIWNVLRKCEAISINGHILHQNLTKEMTRGEIKFALTVESVFNRIPEPEYRQLLVESLMVLTLVAEAQTNLHLGPGVVNVHDIVREANRLFVLEASENNPKFCCRVDGQCGGVAGICKYFYDMPPSGRYGTMSYVCRAVANILYPSEADIECLIS